jgi:Ca2+-binding RTX toxin-like protein
MSLRDRQNVKHSPYTFAHAKKNRRNRLRKRSAMRWMASLEPLESRLLLATSILDGGLTSTLTDGVLTIDNPGDETNDFVLSLTNGGTTLQVTDANPVVDDDIELPFADVDRIILHGQGGDDWLTVDFDGGSPIPSGGIDYFGGDNVTANGDGLSIVGGPGFDSLVYDADTPGGGGSLTFDDTHVINFRDLEPVTVAPVAGTVTINVDPLDTFPGTTITSTVTAGPLVGQNTVNFSVALESMTFANPTTALIINGDANDDDVITFTSVDAGFGPSVTVDGQGGTDTVNYNASMTLAGLTSTAETTNVTAVVDVSGAGTPLIEIHTDNIAITAALNAGTGRVEIDPDTNNRVINLGGVTGGLDLTDTEVDFVTAGVLQIGDSNAGRIRFHGTGNNGLITPANTDTVHLISGSFVDDDSNNNAGGGIRVANLAIEANGQAGHYGILFNNTNNGVETHIETFAARSSNGRIRLVDNNAVADLGLTIGSVDGIVGVINTTPGSANNARERIDIDTATGNLVVANVGAAFEMRTGRELVLRARQNNRDVIIDSGATLRHDLAGALLLRADNIQLNGNIDSPGRIVQLRTDDNSDGDAINIGDTTDINNNVLQISDAELDRITASRIYIGHHNFGNTEGAGDITFTAAVSPGGSTEMRLRTNASVSQNAGATITSVNNLGIQARGDVTLDEANVIASNLAIDVQTGAAATSGNITFRNNDSDAWNINGNAGVGNFLRTDNGDIVVTSIGTVNVDESTTNADIEVEARTLGIGDGDITFNIGAGTTDGRDFQLNDATSGNNDKTNVAADGDININLLGTGDARIFNLDSSRVVAGGSISFDILGSDDNTRIVPHGGAQITSGGTTDFVVRSNNGQFITNFDDSLPVTINSTSGTFTVQVDRWALEANTVLNAAGQRMIVRPFADGDDIRPGDVGSSTGALRISQNEINTITADVLQLGDNSTYTGDIVIPNDTVVNPLQVDTVHLQSTTGNVSDDANDHLDVQDLAITVPAGTVTLDDPDTDVDDLAIDSGGAITIVDTDNLNIATVDAVAGVDSDGNDVDITAGGTLTLDAPITATGATVSLDITSGGIVDNNATNPDITALEAALEATSGIGSGAALETALSTLAASNTASGSIEIDNDAGGLLTIGTVDSLVGVTNTGGAISITNASPLLVSSDVSGAGDVTLEATDTVAAGDDLTINDGITVESTGGNVFLIAGDILELGSPVNSAATVTAIAATNVDISGSETFAIDLNGVASFDQLAVTGGVVLGAAVVDLDITLGFAVANGASFTIIDNDGGDAVSGNFNGLLDGSTFFNAAAPGVPLEINYDGGDGNDVVITYDMTPILVGTAGADHFLVREEVGGNIEVHLTTGPGFGSTINSTVINVPRVNLTDLTINSLAGNDTVTVDYGHTGGFFNLPIVFNGGDPTISPGDELYIERDAFATVTHDMTGADAGNFDIDGNIDLISYTGLEEVDMTVSTVTDFVSNLPAGADNAQLSDQGAFLRLESTDVPATHVLIDFVTPSGSITITGGAGDAVSVSTALDLSANDTDLTITAGTINIDGGSINTDAADQAYNGGVVLGTNTTLTGNDVAFNGSVDSDAGMNRTLLVNTIGAGDTIFDGAVGGTDALSSLTTDATGQTIFGPTSPVSVTTTGNQVYNDAVEVQSDLSLTVGGALTASTIDDDATANDANVVVDVTGATTFNGDIGATNPLTSLDFTSDIALDVNINVTASGDIEFTTTDTAAAGDNFSTSATATITSTAGDIEINSGDNVTIAANTTLAAAAGMISINGDVADADAGTGSTISLLGTFNSDGTSQNIAVTGGADVDTITLDPVASESILLNGAGGNDSYSVQLGNLSGGANAAFIGDAAAEGTDALTIDGTTAVDTFTINATTTADSDETVNYTANLEAITVNGDDGSDVFNVTPSTTATMAINGGNPAAPTSPGDTINYTTPVGQTPTITQTDADGGTIATTGGFQTITYDEIESITFSGDVIISGTADDDLLDIVATGTTAGSWVLTNDVDGDNGGPFVGPTVSFTTITGITFNGLAENDELEVNHPAGLFAPTNGITFNGGTQALIGDDRITINGPAAAVTSVTHQFDAASVPANGNDGSITAAITAGNTSVINYTGVDPIDDNMPAATRTFDFRAAGETVTLADDATPTAGITNITSSLGAVVDFVNPTTTMNIDTTNGSGADTINVQGVDPNYSAALNVTGDNVATEVDTVNFQTAATDVGAGNITVSASAINVNQTVDTTGSVSLTAEVNVAFNASGQLTAAGAGTISIVADNLAGNNGGTLAMTNGSFVDGGTGQVSASADGNVTVSNLTSTTTVLVNSTSGSILDNGDPALDIVALDAVLNAGIAVGTAANAIDTTVADLEGSATTGGFWINETDTLNVGGASGATGIAAGGVIVLTSGTGLTVSETIDSNNVGGTDSITLTSTASTIDIDATVQSNGGDVTTTATGDISFGVNGVIDTETGAGDAVVNSTAGSILDNADTNADVIAATLLATGNGSVGTAAQPIDTQVGNLEGNAATTVFHVSNNADLIVGGIGATVGVNATTDVTITNTGSTTVNENISGTNVTLNTTDALTAGQDITIAASVAVQATAGNVAINSGDDITIVGLSTVNATGAITLTGDVGALVAETAGSTIAIAGTLTATGSDPLISGGADDDSISIDSNAGTNTDGGSIEIVTREFDIVGNGGNDSLFLDDSGDITGDTVDFQGTYVEGLVDALASRRVTYTTVENVTISTSTMDDVIDLDNVSNGNVTQATVNSGLGAEIFRATTNMNTAVLLNAEMPPAPPTVLGDHLIVTTVNVDLPIVFPALTDTTFNSSVAMVANQPISWTSMESFLFDGQLFYAGDIFVRGADDPERIIFSRGNRGKTVVRIDDTFYGQHDVTGKIVVYGEGGRDIISVAGNIAVPAEIHGGLAADQLTGSPLDDTIFGDDENDVILAGDGDNTVDGGDGNDEISAGDGNDTLTGGIGNDDILAGPGNDTVFGGDGTDDISGQDGNDLLFGGTGNDIIGGGRGDDIISGQGGDDSLYGGTGFDILLGGNDSDLLFGQNDDDILVGGIQTDEANIAALQAVLAIWNDTVTYVTIDARIAAIPASFKTPGTDNPFIDDLMGLQGEDWFLAHSEDVTDFMTGTDRQTNV